MMFAMDKGIIENKLSKIGFKAFHAFRPGYIYLVTPGNETNLGYKIWRFHYPVLKLFGDNAGIKSIELAFAMFKVGIDGCDMAILENRDIRKVVSRPYMALLLF